MTTRTAIPWRAAAIVIAMTAAAGCGRTAVRPMAPFPVATSGEVAVLPARNLASTADAVGVRGTSVVDRLLGRPQPTVADMVTASAIDVLREHGWRVVEPAAFGVTSAAADAAAATRIAAAASQAGLLLDVEIRRWEPDATVHAAFVIVGVRARLLETGTGREVWSAAPAVHPIATPGTIILSSAYSIAATTVMRELLAPP